MRRKNLVFVSFIALFVVGIVMVEDAAASSGTTVSVDPPVIWDPTMVPGTQFSIDITVDYVERLLGYQFLMFFNPDVLHGVSVENGDFLGSAGGAVEVYPGIGFDNEKGLLYLFIAELNPGLPPTKYPTGGGVLATVTFEVVGYGKSGIFLGDDTGLLNVEGEWIIHGPENLKHGQFANAEVHDVAVTHISTDNYWCYQGDPIYITVIVENLGDFTEIFDVKVYSIQMGGSAEEIFIGTEGVEDLVPGDSKTLFFVWDTTEVSVGSYQIYAEATGVPGESAWTNNNIVNTTFGGINIKPHEVTLLDLVISWVNLVARIALPVAVFAMVTVVVFKALMSVRMRWPIRLWKRALQLGKPS
ncbi:MAG: hypothetical protein ACETVM_00065 [Candidatus Bathyarchaeia archaeon]